MAACVEIMREESAECVDLMEYLKGVEEDISGLGLTKEKTGQLIPEHEYLESRSLETMMTYFMILEEELTIEKEKVLRLQRVNQEIERDRGETEERNKDLINQKHKLETENQQLRQKLWRQKDLFLKITDELCQLWRQNRMLHEILEMNKNPSVNGKRENENSQTLPRHERLERNAHQTISHHRSNLEETNLNTCTSEPNLQRSSLSLPHCDNIRHKDNNSLLQDFITLKQEGRQNDNNVRDINTKQFEGKSKLHIHEAEEPSAKENSVEINGTESIGYSTEGCCTEEIPVMPAPLPKNMLIMFDDTQSNGENEQPRDKDEDIKKFEEHNIHLTKFLQKLQMHYQDRHNRMYHAGGQNPVDRICTEMPRRTSKAYPECNAKEEALLKAVKSGYIIRVRQAISKGADVNVASLGSWTPLHIAAALGFVYICEELLDAGAMKLAKDRWGDTPLHWAAANGHQQVACLLVHHGDDVFRRGRDGRTPRERALAEGHNDLADWFFKKEQLQRKNSTEA